MGDEGHNRNKAGSLLFLSCWRRASPRLADGARGRGPASSWATMPLAVLNPVMAACKAMADAAHGVEGSTIVTTMARNGTDFGIRVSGLGDRWFTAPARCRTASTSPAFRARTPTPTSATAPSPRPPGSAPSPWRPRRPSSPSSAARPRTRSNATLEMYEITAAEHQHFTIPALDFRGTPVGIDIRKVVELGHHAARQHRHRPPPGRRRPGRAPGWCARRMEIFEEALVAFAERLLRF